MRRILLLVAVAAVVLAVVAGAVAAFLAGRSPDGGALTGVAEATRTAESSPPPSGEIVFTRDGGKPGRQALYVMAADGSRVRLLARDGADPAASPDGRRIAFMRGGGIWIVQRDGSGQRQLTDPPYVATEKRDAYPDEAPAWSPSGRTLYFVRSPDSETHQLFSIRADGTHLVRLAEVTRYYCLGDPSPAPDGRLIAFSEYDCMHGQGGGIAAVTPGGQHRGLPFVFPGSEEDLIRDPAWSPAGGKLAYTLEDLPTYDETGEVYSGGPGGVYVSTSRVSQSPRLVVENGSEPTWSPGGTWIAFREYGGGISVVRPDGTGVRPLSRRGSDSSPAWLPAAS